MLCLKTFVQKLNYDYYDRTAESNGESGDKNEGPSKQAIDRHAPYEARQEKRDGKRKCDDPEECNEITFSEAMDLVMGLWMRHATCEENSTGAGYRPRSKGRSQSRLGLRV